MTFPKPYADQVAKLRVPIGFLLVICFAWFAHPTPKSLSFGLPLAFLGLLLRAWAAGNLRKDSTLTSSGPYSLVRNPLYLGTSTAAAGFAVASGNWSLAALFAVVFLMIYMPVITLEEQHLRDLFPEFSDYVSNVPRLMPNRLWHRDVPYFNQSLYRKNREYEAALGVLIGAAFLVAKYYYRS